MTDQLGHEGASTDIVAKPRIVVIGVGGAGGNAINNMIEARLDGVEFMVANTDAQALEQSLCDKQLQLGAHATQGLGAGSRPEVGAAAVEEVKTHIAAALKGANMVFITAGMGGGTGTGGAPVIARMARDEGILTVAVVTKPFDFEGGRRLRQAEAGIAELTQHVDTMIVIPNQNLFRVADETTTFAGAFKLADEVLHAGVRGVSDLMVLPGLVNLDFADVHSIMAGMSNAVMGTGEAEGDDRALAAAEAAISNPLLDDVSMKGARSVLINITGGADLMLREVDEAATRVREEVDPDANIIFGSAFNQDLEGKIRVSVIATAGTSVNSDQPFVGGHAINNGAAYVNQANSPARPVQAFGEITGSDDDPVEDRAEKPDRPSVSDHTSTSSKTRAYQGSAAEAEEPIADEGARSEEASVEQGTEIPDYTPIVEQARKDGETQSDQTDLADATEPVAGEVVGSSEAPEEQSAETLDSSLIAEQTETNNATPADQVSFSGARELTTGEDVGTDKALEREIAGDSDPLPTIPSLLSEIEPTEEPLLLTEVIDLSAVDTVRVASLAGTDAPDAVENSPDGEVTGPNSPLPAFLLDENEPAVSGPAKETNGPLDKLAVPGSKFFSKFQPKARSVKTESTLEEYQRSQRQEESPATHSQTMHYVVWETEMGARLYKVAEEMRPFVGKQAGFDRLKLFDSLDKAKAEAKTIFKRTEANRSVKGLPMMGTNLSLQDLMSWDEKNIPDYFD